MALESRSSKIFGGESASASASIVVRAHPPPSGTEERPNAAFATSPRDSNVSRHVAFSRRSAVGAVGAMSTTSRATGPSGSARHEASSPSKASNRDDARDWSTTRIRRVVSVCASFVRAASRRVSVIRVSSSSASMIGGSSVETGVTGVTLFRCFANARRNARVRRSRCLAPPSRGARKSATRSGFSVFRTSPAVFALTSANTATSSSLGTPRKTASAVSTAAVAVASEEPGSIAMTVAPTTPPARAVATWKKASPEMFVASARLSFITSARGSEGSAALCAACTETFRPERACLVSLSVSPSGSSQRTPSVTCAPPPTHGETRRTTGGRCPAIWLSATHAPTDTSASRFARAGAASADAVTARHQSVSARIACRATTAGSCSVRVEFASETRDRDGTAPRGVTPRRGVVALSSGGITGSSPAANAMCVATRSRRRASKGRRLGRGDEALSERTSLVRGRFGKKRDFSRELEVMMLGSRARNPRRPRAAFVVCASLRGRERS